VEYDAHERHYWKWFSEAVPARSTVSPYLAWSLNAVSRYKSAAAAEASLLVRIGMIPINDQAVRGLVSHLDARSADTDLSLFFSAYPYCTEMELLRFRDNEISDMNLLHLCAPVVSTETFAAIAESYPSLVDSCDSLGRSPLRYILDCMRDSRDLDMMDKIRVLVSISPTIGYMTLMQFE
jgi:hypothetical protein